MRGLHQSLARLALPEALRPLQTVAGPFLHAAAPRADRQVTAAAARHEPAANAHEAAAAAASQQDPSSGADRYEAWRQLWSSLLRQAYEAGHFSADPGVTPDALESNAGAMKRAVLSLARQRGDILHGLQPAKVKAAVRAGFPVDDRKTKNAHRRLTASVLEGRHLGPADGGPAELQDLLRVFIALASRDRRDAALFTQLQAAALDLLPDVMAAAAKEPPPHAVALQGTQRYMPAARAQDGAAAAPRPPRQRGDRPPQPPRDAAGLPEAWLQEGGWYDGSRQAGSSRGRGGRGGPAGRGGGGRAAGGRGSGRGGAGRGPRPQQQQRRPRPAGEEGGGTQLDWWRAK